MPKRKNIGDAGPATTSLLQSTLRFPALHPVAAGLWLAGRLLITSATSTSTFRSGKWLHGGEAPDH